MDQQRIDDYLENIYYTPSHPASFGGVDKIYNFVKSTGQPISKGRIGKWLRTQDNAVKHKPVHHIFKRRRVIVPRKFYQFDGDTISMTRYAKYNKGYKFILIIIDILSRFCWAAPLKTLTASAAAEALKTVLNRHPKHLRTDGGSEFMNETVKRYLDSQQIKHIQTLNETKANFAERLIQTLKNKITKYMHHKQTFEWVNVLPEIIRSYNHTYHRSIKRSPAEALDTDDPTLWRLQYGPQKPLVRSKPSKLPQNKRSPFKFKVGDAVRLTFNRSKFDRKYQEHWTEEVFTVISRTNIQDIAQYRVKDWSNDPVRGTFYASEMTKVDIKEDREYKIEKVLKYRKRNGKREAFVKWEGWHRKFNSWIEASTIKENSLV